MTEDTETVWWEGPEADLYGQKFMFARFGIYGQMVSLQLYENTDRDLLDKFIKLMAFKHTAYLN